MEFIFQQNKFPMENIICLKVKDTQKKGIGGLKDGNYRFCAVRIADEVSIGWFKGPTI